MRDELVKKLFFSRNRRGNINITMEAYIETMWERFGTTTLISSIVLRKNISMRQAMEFRFPNVQYMLHAFVGRQSGDFSRGGKLFAPRSKLRVGPKRTVGNRESHSILSNTHQARVHEFSGSVLFLGTRAVSDAADEFTARPTR